MRALLAALGLMLLGALGAFPQDRSLMSPCADSDLYYDKAAGKCCYRCSEGSSSRKQCPQGPSDCGKQCGANYYLNRDGRCTACVTCVGDDLVEKKPCSWNSARVCECRPGMFCFTSASNSCARCRPHSVCPPGKVVKFQGTAERDTVCEEPSPSTSPMCNASSEDCRAPASTMPPAQPSLTSLASSDARTTFLGGRPSLAPEDALKMTPGSLSSEGKPSPASGLSPQQSCPPGAPECRKQCDPDYYLDRSGFCMACVTCKRDDLVEKTPCTWNSARVCECRPGMFCVTSATNSCARCVSSPSCPPGMVAKLQGVTERDTTDESPTAGTQPDCSPTAEDQMPSSTIPSLTPLAETQTIKGHEVTSFTESPLLLPEHVLFWGVMIMVVALAVSAYLLCQQKACRKWIRQKLRLCYPAQTFQSKLEPVLKRTLLVAEPGAAELGLTSTPLVETSPTVGAECLESQRLLEASPGGTPPTPTDLSSEPRTTSEHTNNRIEKIYIMKADTVIVGTVKTEVPEGRSLVGPASPVEPELEDLEVDHAPHYPEQETEPPLGSCRDVMFSVEEEGKEDPLPTTASGK
ncbi:Tumor necrosis factor receptor superfamily member 8 [Galemys pyrenaicus]|uniref:Tumor necrosis factor receptor superfamily member 8 n=1 Tax=Galemys pyrenaicus TaxID=202257 RepID=A0A8J6DEP0_GALPY|nr:Tumor necrosis factor receptor superfamily member 8 [Galemys pyrenaicus]